MVRGLDPSQLSHPMLKCGASPDCDCFSVTSTDRLIFRRCHVDRILGTDGSFRILADNELPELGRAISRETGKGTHREATCKTLWTYGNRTGRTDICDHINDLRQLADLQPYTEA